MKLLRDIVCTSTPYGETYTNDYLTGSIVIYGDKLEGMVYDDASSFLVFGEIYSSDIKVVVCTDHDERLPKMYEGMLDGNKYYGDKSVVNRFEEIPFEECRVSLYNPKDYRDVDDKEITKLEKAVSLRKKALGHESKVIYENMYPEEQVFQK